MTQHQALLWKDSMHYQGPISDADISACGKYRWSLSRSWKHGGDGRTMCFVMLNPSTADGQVDDPTIRRCIGFAQREGVSELVVKNLFALRTKNPKILLTSLCEPTGGARGDVELMAATMAHVTVVAWGSKVPFARDRTALEMFHRFPLHCLGTTKNGNPRHPLYVPANRPLEMFGNGAAAEEPTP